MNQAFQPQSGPAFWLLSWVFTALWTVGCQDPVRPGTMPISGKIRFLKTLYSQTLPERIQHLEAMSKRRSLNFRELLARYLVAPHESPQAVANDALCLSATRGQAHLVSFFLDELHANRHIYHDLPLRAAVTRRHAEAVKALTKECYTPKALYNALEWNDLYPDQSIRSLLLSALQKCRP